MPEAAPIGSGCARFHAGAVQTAEGCAPLLAHQQSFLLLRLMLCVLPAKQPLLFSHAGACIVCAAAVSPAAVAGKHMLCFFTCLSSPYQLVLFVGPDDPHNLCCHILLVAIQEFVDERDAGAIYITHFTLLLGLAVPVWLSLVMPGAQVQLTPHSTTQHRFDDSNVLLKLRTAAGSAVFGRSRYGWADPSSALLHATAGLSGLIIIGVGDTAASFVGKLFGRVPVHDGSSKTVEGTLAGISGSLGAWILLLWAVQLLSRVCSWYSLSWWLQLVLATAGAGLMEAATSQLDNILLPLWYLPHLLLVV